LKTRELEIGLLLLAAGLVSWACETPGRKEAVVVSCATDWTRHASPDSLVEICMPSGFNPGYTAISGSYTWKRPTRIPGDSDWVAVAIVADSAGHAEWPPPLASPADCRTDCYTADSAVVHADSIGLAAARLETGLVSGGNEGAQRAPRLVGGWITPGRTRILVVGAAQLAATLDTLRTALQSLRVRIP
jgi:hypothetical protein